eukprot:8292455-Prorocentrum_lima.AAC.1
MLALEDILQAEDGPARMVDIDAPTMAEVSQSPSRLHPRTSQWPPPTKQFVEQLAQRVALRPTTRALRAGR